ncbi:MAG: hypothetical protein AB7P76_09980 [Candidatus Melainabacteria bacterium]
MRTVKTLVSGLIVSATLVSFGLKTLPQAQAIDLARHFNLAQAETPAAPVKTDEAKPAGEAEAAAEAKEAVENKVYSAVSPIDLVTKPDEYLEKNVEFEAVFNRFADTGLNYKKAMRDPKDYVSVLILRPDVKDHEIPLSELKLFFPRTKSNDVMDIESGDKVKIQGTVFSAALKDPWMDIDSLLVLEAKNKDKEKAKKESGSPLDE